MPGVVDRLREGVIGRFDRPAPAWLVRSLGREPPPALDLARVALLREAELDALRDPARLEALLPELGINDDAPEVFPRELRGRLGEGLRYWQYPCQLAPYLALLSGLGIRRYLEIGVQHGGTFVVTTEYLDRFDRVEKAIAVDVQSVRSARDYERMRPGARFVRADSGSARFRALLEREGPFDLALIDGDHARSAVRRDWETVRPHASVVAFHDIVDAPSPGVGEVWREVRREHAGEYRFHEFTRQYADVEREHGRTFLGLGVAVRRDRAS